MTMCFASNFSDVKEAFRDYMGQYLNERMGRKNFSYDKSVDFAEKEKKMNGLIKAETIKLAKVEDADFASPEMLAMHPNVQWASMAIADSLIDMIIPDILYDSLGLFTEQHTVAWGSNWSCEIEPNDLFYVSKVGTDKRTTEYQRQYNGQATIRPEMHAITVAVSWYRVACGLDSLADFVMKAALSMEAQIRKDVFGAFDEAMAAIPTTPAESALNITGWSQDAAIRVAATVEAYNRAPAVFVGTKVALSKILPSDTNYRFNLDNSDYIKTGYLPSFFGYSALELKQVADWKNPYSLALSDKKIYVVSPAAQKLVHLVFEGNSISRHRDFEDNADLSSSTTLFRSYGIGVATNAIAGIINIA